MLPPAVTPYMCYDMGFRFPMFRSCGQSRQGEATVGSDIQQYMNSSRRVCAHSGEVECKYSTAHTEVSIARMYEYDRRCKSKSPHPARNLHSIFTVSSLSRSRLDDQN